MRLVLAYPHYPMTMARLIKEALVAEGHEVISVGPAFGTYIPWTAEGATREGMHFDPKYVDEPTVELPNIGNITWEFVEQLYDFSRVDAFLQPSPGWRILGRPSFDRPHVLVATDPHVLNWWYDLQRKDFDMVFNMQKCYMREGDYYLPYAYAPGHHYLTNLISSHRPIDVVCIGLQYPHRRFVMEELAQRGYNVVSKVGLIFDSYRQIHNQAKVCFSWSSRQDTIARVFEAPRMGCALVINQTPDLGLFFESGVDCLAFDPTDAQNAIEAVEELLSDDEKRIKIATSGYEAGAPHTWNSRVKWMVDAIRYESPAEHNTDRVEYATH